MVTALFAALLVVLIFAGAEGIDLTAVTSRSGASLQDPERMACTHFYTFSPSAAALLAPKAPVAGLKGIHQQILYQWNTTQVPGGLHPLSTWGNPTEVSTPDSRLGQTSGDYYGGALTFTGNCSLYENFNMFITTSPETFVAVSNGVVSLSDIKQVNAYIPLYIRVPPFYRQVWFWLLKDNSSQALDAAIETREAIFDFYNDYVAKRGDMKLTYVSGVSVHDKMNIPYLFGTEFNIGGAYDFESVAAWQAYHAWERKDDTYKSLLKKVKQAGGTNIWWLF